MQKRFFIIEKGSLDLQQNVQFKIFILGTLHLKVPWGTKNGFSMASLQKHPFGTFIF